MCAQSIYLAEVALNDAMGSVSHTLVLRVSDCEPSSVIEVLHQSANESSSDTILAAMATD